MKSFIFILLSFLVFPSAASPLPDFPFVAVTGKSSRNVQPDSVLVSFELTTYAKSSENAGEMLNTSTKKVLEVSKQLSIPMDAITSFEIDKQTKRKRDDDYNSLEILGYEFSRSFSIKLDGLENYPSLIEKLLEIDYLYDISSEFDTSRRDEIEIALVAEAAQNAKEKATIMAAGLDVKIDSVFAFNDSGSFNSFFASFGLSDDFSSERMRVTGARISQVIIPKSIEINKSINVIYKLQ